MTSLSAAELLEYIATTLTRHNNIELNNNKYIQEALRRGSLSLRQQWDNLPEEVQLELRQHELQEKKKEKENVEKN